MSGPGQPLSPPGARPVDPNRLILRGVLTVVAVVIGLYVLYLVRQPILWVLMALFLAVALSRPVNWLQRKMRRGFAIAIVYLLLIIVPALLALLIFPPLVTQGTNLVNDLPAYVQDVQDFANRNPTLRRLERDYQVTERLQEQARELPTRLGDAAGVLQDVGLGLVNSLFALVTILVLAAFMLGSGRFYVDRFVELQPPDRGARLRRVFDRSADAVGAYVGGALVQATIAGLLAYIVLSILGVPFRAPLAVLIFVLDLVPLVGATIGAAFVGVVTVFANFPTATIVWVVWSILYQQLENNVIQPRIQQRAVDVHPLIVLISVLCGSALMGVLGALVAIPVAATVQIALREWWDYRKDQRLVEMTSPTTGTPAPSATLVLQGDPSPPPSPRPPEGDRS
jgi:predicted PurR-regulated permease PerM